MKNKINIIGISGRMESGKDTVAEMIQKEGFKYDSQDWQVRKFADKLKVIASILTGYEKECFENQEFKKIKLSKQWNNMPVREFLQRLGTDAIRNGLHSNTWINAFWSDYGGIHFGKDAFKFPKWIITDVRFTNEADSIKEREGVVIRLTRNEDVEATHPSEIELDDYDFDYIINNKNQSLDETREEINYLLKVYNG